MAGRGRSFKRRGNPASIFTQKKKREEDEAKKTIFDIPDIPHNTEECDSDSEIYEVTIVLHIRMKFIKQYNIPNNIQYIRFLQMKLHGMLGLVRVHRGGKYFI